MALYRIVPERSQLAILARSSMHPIALRADRLDGWLDLALEDDGRVDLTASRSAHVELPVNALRSGNAFEDAELLRLVGAARYPMIGADLTEMKESGGDGRYLVRGALTFREVSRTYQDMVTVVQVDQRTLRLEGESSFDVRDFGLEPPRILLLKVEPEVRVTLSIVAERT